MRKYIGDKAFYSMLFAVLIPIVVQSSISNFVNLLDNLMVGSVGTEEMSGVAIANQLLMIFNICIFGGLSGAGIFTSQFYGSKNDSGVRETFRIKIFIGTAVLIGFTAVFLLFPRQLISLYLTDGEGAGDLEKTLTHSMAYLRIMLVGNLPFVVTNIYAERTTRTKAITARPCFLPAATPIPARRVLRPARRSEAGLGSSGPVCRVRSIPPLRPRRMKPSPTLSQTIPTDRSPIRRSPTPVSGKSCMTPIPLRREAV